LSGNRPLELNHSVTQCNLLLDSVVTTEDSFWKFKPADFT